MNTVAVVGAGTMGNGIAHLFAQHGWSVTLIDVSEAARRLGIKRSLTYRLIQTRQLRSVKVAGARRVLVSDLEAFVSQLKDVADDEQEWQ